MSEPQTQTATEQTEALFDRYMLPKVALTVILAASLVGTWVTTTLSGTASLTLAVAKWGYFVALGVLTGGLVWKHVFVRPSDLADDARSYCADMYARFDRIEAGTLVVLAVGGAVAFQQYLTVFGRTAVVAGYAVLLAAVVALAVTTIGRETDIEQQFRSPTGLATLALALLAVVATAVAEVALRGFEPVAAAVRVLHLLAFVVWIGGAVWNIFVAVPMGQERQTIGAVQAAGEQLERFRWAVRFIIPTLLLTGFFQAVHSLGTNVQWYLGTAIGAAVLAKAGFIGLLFVIFKLCPMWRACSPIEGVCELNNAGGRGIEATGATGEDRAGGNTEATTDD